MLFPVAVLAYLFSISWLATHGPLGAGGWIFGATYALAFAGMVVIWKSWPIRGGMPAMILLALAARGLMLWRFPASDDVWRYLWEGRIQLHGFNPYLLAPNASELEPLRTAYWQLINHRDWATIYFPASQWMFRGIAGLGESPLGVKIVVTAFDLGTAIVLWFILRKSKTDTKHLSLYLLNPLVILFTAGEGHFESVMVFWVLAAVYLAMSRRQGFMFLCIGMAVMVNIKAAMFVPLFLRRDNVKSLPVFFLPLFLAVPFLDAGVSFLDIPLRFASELRFNSPVFAPIADIFSGPIAIWGCGLMFLCAGFAIFFMTPDPRRAVFLCSAAFLIFSPTVHPWYLLLVTPWLALYPSVFWGTLHLTVAAVFPVYFHAANSGVWRENPGLFLLEFLPALAALLWAARSGFGKSRSEIFSPANTLSVVIPVLNEKENIEGCIDSIASPPSSPSSPEINLRARGARGAGRGLVEVIVVDGGSTDGTAEKAREIPGVKVLASEPGRGKQIARGVSGANGDVILVLHADSRLRPGAMERMMETLQARPDAAGGAFGADYRSGGFKFRIIAALNNFRANILGIGFGDQAQFFRREALPDGFPSLRLMEDIELSLRLKEAGSTVFLPSGAENATRRWRSRGYLRNALMVIRLSAQYLLWRRFGLNMRDASGFYLSYYGSAVTKSRAAGQIQ